MINVVLAISNRISLSLFFLILLLSQSQVSAESTAEGTSIKPALRECKTQDDCIMIDARCGKPAAVNKLYRSYTEAPEGCDKSSDYVNEAKLYTVVCNRGECSLSPIVKQKTRSKKNLKGKSKRTEQ